MIKLSQHELLKVDDRGIGEEFINSGAGDERNNKRMISCTAIDEGQVVRIAQTYIRVFGNHYFHCRSRNCQVNIIDLREWVYP